MRRLILALLLLLPLLAVPCSGAEVPSFTQVDELLEEADIRLDGPLNINVEDGRLVIASSETEQDDPLNDLESGFLTRLQRSGVSLNGLR